MAFGNVLMAAFGIGLLIFLHELGHFLAARAAGVRVEVFSLGFGPRLLGFPWRGTDFRLSAIPFGGYVMVAGQDPTDRRFPPGMSLWAKSVGQRALFWSGGVLMNALFALVVFPLVFRAGVAFQAPIAGPVANGTAAWEAGITAGERIVEVAGKPVYAFQNLFTEVALHGSRPVELLVEGSGGERRVVTATPHYNRQEGLYELGLEPAYRTDPPVLTVRPDGAAHAAGIATGDRLLAIDGAPPARFGDLPGFRDVTLRIEREGSVRDVVVTPRPTVEGVPARIGVRPLSRRIAGIRPGAALVERLGLLRDDRIVAIDGRPFLSGDLAVAASGPLLTRWQIVRDGEVRQLSDDAATPADRQQLVAHVALGLDPGLQLLPVPEGAAAAAGLLPGDWVQAVDGEPLRAWRDLQRAVERAADRELTFRVLRPDPDRVVAGLDEPSGTPLDLTIRPRVEPAPDLGITYQLEPEMNEIRAASFGEALRLGTVCSLDLVKQLYVMLKRLITGEVGANNLGGIVRIGQISYQAAERGASWFWYFLALLSVNLAFVNLLPIPVLDGGHLLFLLIEKVKGSPVSTRVLGYSQIVGLVFVLLLVLFVTYNDILRLL